MSEALELRHVSMRFGTLLAVNAIDLAIDSGERLAIVGESGAGKSTLLNIIAGTLRPTSGCVLMEGVDVTALDPPGRSVGLLFQSDALYPHMTAFENVAFPLRARNTPKGETRAKVNQLLEEVGLFSRAESLPKTLSGGERQRVALARALALQPRILLLDEPFANLDVPLRRRMRALLLDLHQEKRFTLIVVTHDPVEAAYIGHRIGVIRTGSLVALDTGRSLYWKSPSQYVAELFGPCNVITAQVDVSDGEGRLSVLNTELSLEDRFSSFLPNGKCQVFVRPEAVLLEDSVRGQVSPRAVKPESDWLEGKVVNIVDTGKFVMLKLAVNEGGQTLQAVLDPQTGVPLPQRGDVVRWRLDQHRIHLLALT